jgi:hypothetical protein
VGAARPTDWKSYDRVADEYNRLTPPLLGPLARDLIALLRLPAAGLLLDVGTGTGAPADFAPGGWAVPGAAVPG